MARIRTVKPEFWTHPIMGRLDDSSKSLAIALLNFSDDEGYFLADPNLVRSSCRPFDDDSTIVRRCLAALIQAGWIEVKVHPTHGAIGLVVNFTAHQKIDRPKVSNISTYFIDDESTIDRRLIAVGMEGNVKEGNGLEDPKPTRTRKVKGKKPTNSVPVDLLPSLQTLVDEWPKQCLNNGVTQRLAGFSDPVSLYEQMTKHWPREEPELMVNCGLLYLDSIVYPTDEWTGKRGMPGFVYAMANFYGPKQEYWKRNKGEVLKTMMEANNATA